MFIDEIININNKNIKLLKLIIFEPHKNKKLLLNYLKNKKGVYIFNSQDNKNIYVGHSINLYSRINTYFMPSILNTKARRVLKYFNKYGFNSINLTVYILIEFNITLLIDLEQYFINLLKPNLNVDLIAKGTGFHWPMSSENKLKLQLERGIKMYLYCSFCHNLLYFFNSKQDLLNKLNIHNMTLKNCIQLNKIYLNSFIISELILNNNKTNELNCLLNFDQLFNLIHILRTFYLIKHPHSRKVNAEFINNNFNFIKSFNSINELTKYLKGDKKTISKYLNNNNNKLYRGKWKLYYII